MQESTSVTVIILFYPIKIINILFYPIKIINPGRPASDAPQNPRLTKQQHPSC